MSALDTPICELFGVAVPIVQTGMGWVSGPKLTAATSAAGGLGILAAATMTLEELGVAIRSVRERTDKPFGVNLRADQPDIEQRCDLLVDEGVRVASFARAPGPRVIERLKERGMLVVPTIGTRRHAEKVASWGVDAVIAQGHEGGGHTGPVPTSVLLPQVCEAVDLPVLAAGGFRDGRGLVAALAWGAQGIAMGTRFLLTRESGVPDEVKARYLAATVTDTVVTTAVDGVPQRVVRTAFVDRLERSGWLGRLLRAAGHAVALRRMTKTSLTSLIREGLVMRRRHGLSWPQVALAPSAPMLTRAALVDGRQEAGILPTGQVVGLIEELPAVAEVIAQIVTEAEDTLKRLGADG
jgi:NAD(P)H-dependent flavin oxidoreductase YrpB (nitropropane dioxygenase family)